MLRSFARSLQRVGRVLAGENPMNPKPLVLFDFSQQQDVDRWHVFSDANFGGQSHADWRRQATEGVAEFSGWCSTDVAEDSDLLRAGYCCATSKIDAIGDYFDLENYSHLVLTVRGDGSTYLATLRVDSIGSGGNGDVWQAPFRTSRGAWSEVRIPLGVFAMTNRGRLVERRMEMARDKVMSIGVSVSALSTESAAAAESAPAVTAPAAAATAAQAAAPPENRAVAAAAVDSGSAGESACGGGDSSKQAQTGDSLAGAADGRGFRLLLREIRADGRAGDPDLPLERL